MRIADISCSVCSGPKEWSARVVRQVIDSDLLRNTKRTHTDHSSKRRAELLMISRENSDYRVIQGLNCSSFSRRLAIDSASRRSEYFPMRTRKTFAAPAGVVTNAG